MLPDELVVCDDLSTDNTCEIVERFASTVPFAVRLYKNTENLGYAQNFSKVLSLCRGEIVFLSDQDDVWLTDKIETVLNVFDDYPKIQLVIHDLEFCNSDLQQIGQRKIERIESFSDPMKDYVTGMATAIRGSFLHLCLPVPIGVPHDEWLHDCARILAVKKIMFKVLSLYRRHSSNATVEGQLNIPEKLSLFDFLLHGIKNLSQNSLNKSLIKSYALNDWLKLRKNKLLAQNIIDVESMDLSIKDSDLYIRHINQRIKNNSVGRLYRVMPVLELYFSGGYRDFNGVKSAIKDILRR